MTGRYKEIMQAGLECVGDIDALDVFEVVYLGAKSLSLISQSFALDLSHMGIVRAVLDAACPDYGFQKEFIRLLSEKNSHDARLLCKEWGVCGEAEVALLSLISTYGDKEKVLAALEPICVGTAAEAAYRELSSLVALLKKTPMGDSINIDFSVVNNMKYYNGIVFKGFVDGIS